MKKVLLSIFLIVSSSTAFCQIVTYSPKKIAVYSNGKWGDFVIQKQQISIIETNDILAICQKNDTTIYTILQSADPPHLNEENYTVTSFNGWAKNGDDVTIRIATAQNKFKIYIDFTKSAMTILYEGEY